MSRLWGALWYSKNNIDGTTKHLINEDFKPVLFKTRKECREWIFKRYGYIKTRKDLRSEPHGWRLPIPIKVKVTAI